MKPTKEDWDRFGREIMTGGRSEDVTTERNYENIIKENEKLKQDKEELKNKLDRLEKYVNERSYFGDSRYCCEVQVDLKHILNNEKLNSED